jgi:methionyl aminopeptidase
MTEKDYSGTTLGKISKNAKASNSPDKEVLALKKKTEKREKSNSEDSSFNIEGYKKAGKIAKQVVDFGKSFIKKDMLLSEIASKIENEITKLGGEIAFPVNLSIDDVAAHYTPTTRDDKKAEGLLKVDIGVQINGCIADTAFTLDLTADKKHTKLIAASENALKAAILVVKQNKEKTTLSQIGKAINDEIKKLGFNAIVNLSGHSLGEFEIHSGLTIPNYDNSSNKEIGEGAFAIEPFATISTGSGLIYEAGGSSIYHIRGAGQVRDSFAREVLEWILENKKTLPFSQREIEKQFGIKALVAISNLKRAGAIEEYPQLIEKNHTPISQAENSLIIHKGIVEVLVE